MHDNPSIWPTLPGREVTEDEKRLMLDPVRGTEWQTCWEYKLSHTMTDAEGAAFWTGANLAMDALRAALAAATPPGRSEGGGGGA